MSAVGIAATPPPPAPTPSALTDEMSVDCSDPKTQNHLTCVYLTRIAALTSRVAMLEASGPRTQTGSAAPAGAAAAACTPSSASDSSTEQCFGWCFRYPSLNCNRCKCKACAVCRVPAGGGLLSPSASTTPAASSLALPASACTTVSKLPSITGDGFDDRSSALPGDQYRASNSVDGSTSSFFLSNDGQARAQWIVYDLGAECTVSFINIGNGNFPFGAKEVRVETSSSKSGPFRTAWGLTVSDSPAYDLQRYDAPEPATTLSRWVRIFFKDTWGSSRFMKVTEIEFWGCTSPQSMPTRDSR